MFKKLQMKTTNIWEKNNIEKPQRKALTSASTAKAHGKWPRLFQPPTFRAFEQTYSPSAKWKGDLCPFCYQNWLPEKLRYDTSEFHEDAVKFSVGSR